MPGNVTYSTVWDSVTPMALLSVAKMTELKFNSWLGRRGEGRGLVSVLLHNEP